MLSSLSQAETAKDLFRTLVEGSPVAKVVVTADGLINLVNARAETLFGYRREELIGRSAEILLPERSRLEKGGERPSLLLEKPNNQTMGAGSDLVGRRKDGTEVNIEISLTPLQTDTGRFVLMSMIDISERKRVTDDLMRSLQEKNTLLQEIHHRVKNNLQVISSLLIMQAEAVNDAATEAKLLEMQRRVMSMAMIHEQLYGNEAFSSIDLAKYIRDLTEDLVSSYTRGAAVNCHLSLSPVELNIEQAIPCGLILNELITNALKYAYPAGLPADIGVSLASVGKQVCLTVSDQGVGLPPGFDWKRSGSLGLKLTRVLAKQIKGQMEVSGPPGASFTLRFSKPEVTGAAVAAYTA